MRSVAPGWIKLLPSTAFLCALWSGADAQNLGPAKAPGAEVCSLTPAPGYFTELSGPIFAYAPKP